MPIRPCPSALAHEFGLDEGQLWNPDLLTYANAGDAGINKAVTKATDTRDAVTFLVLVMRISRPVSLSWQSRSHEAFAESRKTLRMR